MPAPFADYGAFLNLLQRQGIAVLDLQEQLKCGLTSKELLGSGTAMNVYEGRLCQRGKSEIKVAVREPRQVINDRTRERIVNDVLFDIQQELRIMKMLEWHPNVVRLYGVAFKDLKPVVAIEYAVASLPTYLAMKKEEGQIIDWETKKRFCCEIAEALRAIHRVNIVHGDIKGESFLMFAANADEDDGRLVVKICDFKSSAARAAFSERRGASGSTSFDAPECTMSAPVEMRQNWGDKRTRDKYSYGLVVWQVVKDGEEPWEDVNDDEIERLKHHDPELSGLKAKLDDSVPDGFKNLITSMTRYSPEERASLADVKNMLNVDAAVCPIAEADLEVQSWELPPDVGKPQAGSLHTMPLSPALKTKLMSAYEVKATSKKDPELAEYISECYEKGADGAAMDIAKTVDWAIKAAEYGSLRAVGNLLKHVETRHLPGDPTVLRSWFVQAANAGFDIAKMRIMAKD